MQRPAVLALSLAVLAASLLGGSRTASAGNPDIGPRLLSNIKPGTAPSDPGEFTALGAKTVFVAEDYRHAREVWISDGTPPGTHLLKDINSLKSPINAAETQTARPSGLTSFQGKVFFSAVPDGKQRQLWVTDGTAAGTKAVKKDIVTGTGLAVFDTFTVVGNKLFFVVSYPSLPAAAGVLWVTDGTTAGTRKVVDLARPLSYQSHINSATAMGGYLYFDRWTSAAQGRELWRSDGEPAGTTLVKDLLPESNQSGNPTQLTTVGTQLFFRALESAGSALSRLWVSDGTTGGTRLVQSVDNAARNTSPDDLTAFGSQLLFQSWAPGEKVAPWISDGTATGTRRISSSTTLAGHGVAQGFAVADGKAYFRGSDTGTGIELWVTDGTDAGTEQVRDIRPGTQGSEPQWLTPLTGGVVFVAFTDGAGRELWYSDGTSGGTHAAGQIVAGAADPVAREIAVHHDIAWLAAVTTAAGSEPWVYEPGPTYLSWIILRVGRTLRYGQGATVSVTVGSGAPLSSKTVTVYDAGRLLCTVTLAGGKGACKLPATWRVGAHALRAEYAGGGVVRPSASGRTVTVTKAVSTTTTKLSASSIKASKRAKVTVRVKVDKVVPTGRVTVTIARKNGRARTVGATLKAVHKGTIKIKLPKLAKGIYTVKATYAGNALIAADPSPAKRLKVA